MKQAKGLYQSDDGKLWRSMKLCKSHNAWLELVALCDSALTPSTKDQVEPFAEWVVDNGDDITRILRANPIQAGGEFLEDEVTT